MTKKLVISLVFVLVVLGLLTFYWLFPFNAIEFGSDFGTTNFTIGDSTEMQFYENMRYRSNNISYKIEDCTLQKQDRMEQAFDMLEEKSVLNFYPAGSDEEISISCEEKDRLEGGLFIAGEGGPVKIIDATKFSVIFQGSVLLLRDPVCESPNVELHELLHALGFEHSQNPGNIMYNVSKCEQEIGEDILGLINELYAFPSYADLAFSNASAVINNKLLDVNMTIKNIGLKDSEEAEVKISADGKVVKKFDLDKINLGEGKLISLGNILITELNIENIELEIDAGFNELEKENNRIILNVRNP